MFGDIHHENILDEVGMEHKSLQLFISFSNGATCKQN